MTHFRDQLTSIRSVIEPAMFGTRGCVEFPRVNSTNAVFGDDELRGIRHLLVLDNAGKLAAVFSVDDLLDKLENRQIGRTRANGASA